MAKWQLTSQAVEDLSKIWTYTFEVWSEMQADHYYEVLISNCQRVAEDPGIGKRYDSIAKNLLGIKVNRHIIFYRTTHENDVEVIRILHERMDLKQRILE